MALTCPNCGFSNSDGATFCEGCGTRLQDPASAGAPPPPSSPPSFGAPPPPPVSSGGYGGGYGGIESPPPPPPEFGRAASRPPGGIHPHPANLGWISEAWAIISADLGSWIGFFFVVVVIVLVVQFGIYAVLGVLGMAPSIAEIIADGGSGSSSGLGMGSLMAQQGAGQLGNLLAQVLSGIVFVGAASSILRRLRFNDPLDIGTFFQDALARILPAALYSVIINIIVSCGYCFLLIPGIWLSSAMMLGYFRLADGAPDFWSAFSDGLEVAKADVGGYILFPIVVGLVVALGYCLCIVGVFVTAPIGLVAWALAYRASFD